MELGVRTGWGKGHVGSSMVRQKAGIWGWGQGRRCEGRVLGSIVWGSSSMVGAGRGLV